MPKGIWKATNSHSILKHASRDATYTTPKRNIKLNYDYSINIENKELEQVKSFKYLGSTVNTDKKLKKRSKKEYP